LTRDARRVGSAVASRVTTRISRATAAYTHRFGKDLVAETWELAL
jgi:hypothetical protein